MRLLLSVLYQASVGSTKSEIQHKSYLSDKEESSINIKDNVNHVFASPSVKLANKVYVKEGESINANFQAIIGNYKSEIQQVNFNQPEIVAESINQWVESQTNGLIKNLVDPKTISEDSAIYLVNTLYFKAAWAKPFPKLSVSNETFTSFDKVSHSIKFMTQYGRYRQGAINSIKSLAIEIPYKQETNFVFWVILPNADSNIQAVKESLSPSVISDIDSTIKEQTCILSLPLFEISSEVNLKSALTNLGIGSLFSKGEINILDNSPPLVVSDAKQKNKIIVDTEGTEAASANCKYNIINFNNMCINHFNFVDFAAIPMTIIPEVTINRPFIYLILTADTHEPIFVGHFSNPN